MGIKTFDKISQVGIFIQLLINTLRLYCSIIWNSLWHNFPIGRIVVKDDEYGAEREIKSL